MRNGLRAFLSIFLQPHFLLLSPSLIFHPVLQGKVIEQSDIVQFTGMAKEQNDFSKENRGRALLDQ